MKKFAFVAIIAVLFNFSYADTSNEITVADLKIAVKKLIEQYKQLSANSNYQYQNFSSEIQKLRNEINQHKYYTDKELREYFAKIDRLKRELEDRKIILIRKKDCLDNYIASFVRKNDEVLSKIGCK